MKVDVSHYLTLRRSIHQHPELSYQEVETTRRIREFLNEHGLTFNTFADSTGGFVRIDNQKEKTVCLRADIDALPLTEKTGVEYASENKGIMHACGHDVHTAIAAGVACELARVKDKLPCNVVVLFQPAEESSPIGGARPIVESGFLEQQNISEVYGLHNWPSLNVGEIGVKPGAIMAASDQFSITVHGKTAHAAEPHLGVDAIMIGAQIHSAVTAELRRELDPFDPLSISIGTFRGEGRYNIVCECAELKGTVRTTSEKTRHFIHRRIKELAEQIAAAYGGSAEAKITEGYGVVDNSTELYKRFLPKAISVLGTEHVHTDIHTSLIGEDMYYYGTKVPILYFHLGSQSEYPLHNSNLLIDERCISVGIDLLTELFLDMRE